MGLHFRSNDLFHCQLTSEQSVAKREEKNQPTLNHQFTECIVQNIGVQKEYKNLLYVLVCRSITRMNALEQIMPTEEEIATVHCKERILQNLKLI